MHELATQTNEILLDEILENGQTGASVDDKIEAIAARFVALQDETMERFWQMARICAELTTDYGKGSVTSFVEAVRATDKMQFSESTFYSYARAYSTFKNYNQSQNLKVDSTHYLVAATEAHGDADKAIEYVEIASANDMSVGQMKEYIAHRKAQETDDAIRDVKVNLYLNADRQAKLSKRRSDLHFDSWQQAIYSLIDEI